MKDTSMVVQVNDIDYEVIFTYTPGYPPKTSKLPEDCYLGEPDEVDISSVYLYLYNAAKYDLVDALSDKTLAEMVKTILKKIENLEDEAKGCN